jgi:hypothetical protein
MSFAVDRTPWIAVERLGRRVLVDVERARERWAAAVRRQGNCQLHYAGALDDERDVQRDRAMRDIPFVESVDRLAE